MLYDTIIIGGGASGLMAACALAQRGHRVALLEKQPRVGRKLLSTGNGRCNLTHRGANAAHYHGASAAAEIALQAWPPDKVEAFFTELGVPCVADEEGRVYPMSQQAASVLDALRLCCDERGVDTFTDFHVIRLSRTERGFEALTEDGQHAMGKTVIVATGGLAAPKLGASGEGYILLEAFGHSMTPLFPSIAALKTATAPIRGLKGIRAACEISLHSERYCLRAERGEILFSDTGISGIAAMQLCRKAYEVISTGRPCSVWLNLVPDLDTRALLTARAKALPQRRMEDFLNGIVQKRLGQAIVRAAGLSMNRTAGGLSAGELICLADTLSGWSIPVTDTLGFDHAQVTAGGASLGDFDPQTMMSLHMPGLYAAGEVLDVDGDCGGFNLQWAWSSALLAVDGICTGR